MIAIEFKNVSKSFVNIRAVEDVSFTINKGELISILGPSGCGKTTLLRLIAGLEYPDSGRIEIDGIIHSAGNIGMVFQHLALWPHMSVFENIEFGLKTKKFSKKERADKVNKMLALIGIFEKKDKYISELSGGEKQRVALARTLAVEPGIILFDEPFSSLDSDLRYKIRNEVKNLLLNLKITGVYVTHNKEDAVFMSKKIVIMNKGRIEQFDIVEKIFDFNKICGDCAFNSSLIRR